MSAIEKYFNGETLQCSIGIAISLVSIAIGIYFLFWLKTPLYKGIAYPFLILALLLIAVCTSVILKSPKDIQRITTYATTKDQKLSTEELPRMQQVLKTFKTLKIVELVIIIVGIILTFIFSNSPFIKGIAIGFIIQACMLYAFDYIAMERGKGYYEYLNSETQGKVL